MFDPPRMAAIRASTPGLSTTFSRTKYWLTTCPMGTTVPSRSCGTNGGTRCLVANFRSSAASARSLNTALAVASLPAPRP